MDLLALSKINKIKAELNNMASEGATHGHLNKAVIDDLTDNAGQLNYKGQKITTDLSGIEAQLNDIASNPSTVIVAASNSSDKDKQCAHYICDGINDEIELQAAIDNFLTVSGRVILCNGDYYIDSWQDSGDSAHYWKYGLIIKNPNVQRFITIEGIGIPMRKYSNPPRFSLTSTATIHLTSAAYTKLLDNRGIVLGAVQDFTTGGERYPGRGLSVKNIAITIPDNQKPITLLSAQYLTQFMADGVFGSVDTELTTLNSNPAPNCVGILGMQTARSGSGYRISNSLMYGMRVGFSVGGEHLIMEQCTSRYCYYPFMISGYDNGGGAHPITLINCCGELCKCGIRFANNTFEQTVNLIDYNMEYTAIGNWTQTVFATEEVIGQNRGEITYTVTNIEGGSINFEGVPFWTNGHGQNFRTLNTHSARIGTTANRPQNPNKYQMYLDTTLDIDGLPIMWNGSKWIKFDGTDA